jgi:hypothetical protein
MFIKKRRREGKGTVRRSGREETESTGIATVLFSQVPFLLSPSRYGGPFPFLLFLG